MLRKYYHRAYFFFKFVFWLEQSRISDRGLYLSYYLGYIRNEIKGLLNKLAPFLSVPSFIPPVSYSYFLSIFYYVINSTYSWSSQFSFTLWSYTHYSSRYIFPRHTIKQKKGRYCYREFPPPLNLCSDYSNQEFYVGSRDDWSNGNRLRYVMHKLRQL